MFFLSPLADYWVHISLMQSLTAVSERHISLRSFSLVYVLSENGLDSRCRNSSLPETEVGFFFFFFDILLLSNKYAERKPSISPWLQIDSWLFKYAVSTSLLPGNKGVGLMRCLFVHLLKRNLLMEICSFMKEEASILSTWHRRRSRRPESSVTCWPLPDWAAFF